MKRVFLALVFAIYFSGCFDSPERTYNEALNKHDASICESIEDRRMSTKCLFDMATFDNNLTLCAYISEPVWVEDCLIEIARIRGDHTLCKDIERQTRREACEKAALLHKTI